MSEVEARHKKELKALDTEKRTALKKIKGTAGKGKKAKDLLAATEAEYDAKLKELLEKHATELSSIETTGTESAMAGDEPSANTAAEADNEERQRKWEKARRKREKVREKELERERQIAEETANAGPAPRQVENEMIMQHLEPFHLTIRPVAADGHCLYRAVAAQTGNQSSPEDYLDIRRLCADTLEQHQDFAPFCEYTDSVPDFAAYVEHVRSSAEWGGHLELRVLSMALKRPVWIYSATGLEQPLVIEAGGGDCHNAKPIRLSYHRQYYSLGEHYNEVVEKSEE